MDQNSQTPLPPSVADSTEGFYQNLMTASLISYPYKAKKVFGLCNASKVPSIHIVICPKMPQMDSKGRLISKQSLDILDCKQDIHEFIV